MEIHPSAVVSPHAELATGVRIGPYSVIGDHVIIGTPLFPSVPRLRISGTGAKIPVSL